MVPLVLFLLLAADPPFRCPDVHEGKEFLRVTLYSGKAGGEEFELAPDENNVKKKSVTEIWRLRQYRDMPMFLRCRYRNTNAVVTKEVPDPLTLCTFKFEMDKGQISGKPAFECTVKSK